MRHISFGFGTILLALVCIFGQVGVVSAASKPSDKGQAHFEPFEFPGATSSEYIYFTLFINPTRQRYLVDLCKQEPRIRETVYKMMNGRKNLHTWGLKDRLLRKASAALKKRINKAVNKLMVSEALFLRGYVDYQKGAIEDPIIPNPWSCKEIWTRAKAMQDQVTE